MDSNNFLFMNLIKFFYEFDKLLFYEFDELLFFSEFD